MAELSNATKQTLERLLNMRGGYVLDFTNAEFADFVETAIGVNPYRKYEEDLSKARLLRCLWADESDTAIAQLNFQLLGRWKVSVTLGDAKGTPAQIELCAGLMTEFDAIAQQPDPDPVDLEFLSKDFTRIDLSLLPRTLTAQRIVEARLEEITLCLDAGAYLSVMFLAGSTLEGLLSELALGQKDRYLASAAAPRRQGKIKPLDQWILAELIEVSGTLDILSPDVTRHAGEVRNFRNYIHPRQQLKEQFEPREYTARIAEQVLRGALRDLGNLASQSRV